MCNHIIQLTMTNLTLAIPEELSQRMKRHTEIRWSEVVRKSIAEQLVLLETMEKIAKNSRLTEHDVQAVSHKIKAELFHELDRQ